jgi:hypothetical protein
MNEKHCEHKTSDEVCGLVHEEAAKFGGIPARWSLLVLRSPSGVTLNVAWIFICVPDGPERSHRARGTQGR